MQCLKHSFINFVCSQNYAFMGKRQTRSFGDRLRDKFRLIIYNDNNFEEVWYIRLTRLNMFALTISLFVLIVVGVFALVAYTSIREMIPGYPDGNRRRTILMNAVRLDALENEIRMRDRYFHNIRALISGEEPDNLVNLADTSVEISSVDFSKSLIFDRNMKPKFYMKDQVDLNMWIYLILQQEEEVTVKVCYRNEEIYIN